MRQLEILQEPLPALDLDKQPEIAGLAEYMAFYGLEKISAVDGVSHRFGTVTTASHTIAVHGWLQESPRGTCFLIHGLFDHVGLYDQLIMSLVTNGMNVVAPDLPGHGLSSGKPTDIAGFQQYLDALQTVMTAAAGLEKPWHLIGQSTGGAVAATALLEDLVNNVDKLVLLAPLYRPAKWRGIRFLHLLGSSFIHSVRRGFNSSSHDKSFLKFIQERDPLQSRRLQVSWLTAMFNWQKRFQQCPVSSVPALLVQGDADTTVAWKENLELYRQKFRDLTVTMIPGARHHLVNEKEAYRQAMIEAVEEFLG